MEKFKSLIDLGMVLKSTPRQLKNGTYVFRSPEIKTDYYIYTFPITGLVKRINFLYDYQSGGQMGSVALPTSECELIVALDCLLAHYRKYLKRHQDNSLGIKDGTPCCKFYFDKRMITTKASIQSFLNGCQIIDVHSNKCQKFISTNELCRIFDNVKCSISAFAGFYVIPPDGVDVHSLDVMLKTIFNRPEDIDHTATLVSTRDCLLAR